MKYIFGPVVSRRLGVSLGLDIIPYKTCTLDCIYCECGKTTNKTIKRKPYVKAVDILKELKACLKKIKNLDYITLAGSGEPTLNSEIGILINEIKQITDIPVVVLTNGTLLYQEKVRKDLLNADLIIPSLDGVQSGTFLKIDRPHKHLNISEIIKGLIQFRKIFKGLIWLEIFFVQDINDQEIEIEKMIDTINKIYPDKVQLNTIDRPPTESFAYPEEDKKLWNIYNKFLNHGINAEIIKPVKVKKCVLQPEQENIKRQIINLIKRRPETAQHISFYLSIQMPYVNKILRELEEGSIVQRVNLQNKFYYKIK